MRYLSAACALLASIALAAPVMALEGQPKPAPMAQPQPKTQPAAQPPAVPQPGATKTTPMQPAATPEGVQCRVGQRLFNASTVSVEQIDDATHLKAAAGAAPTDFKIDLRAVTPAIPGRAALLTGDGGSTVALNGAAAPITQGAITFEALNAATAQAPGKAKGRAEFNAGGEAGFCAFDVAIRAVPAQR